MCGNKMLFESYFAIDIDLVCYELFGIRDIEAHNHYKRK